jgi:glycerol kinase
MSGNILAIDQGTTNTKALVIDPSGTVLARGSQPTSISYPQPGWVEQDALEVWRCTREAINECLSALDEPDLAAVAVTNQRETALVWERKTGKPVGPCVVWQCRRTASFCNELKAQGLEALLQERTGLQVDPMFSASKIRWILDYTKDGHRRAERGELCAGNIDSWVLWNLTGGAVHATDMTNASRTQLLNLHELEWDGEVLDIFGIPSAALPEIKPSSYVYGETVPIDSLPGGVPIASLIGDSHASLYGQGGFKPGSIKATYGTGSSLMTPTSAPLLSENGLSTTIAWARKKATYALEGNIYATGAAVEWLGHLLGLDDPGPGVEKLARTVEDAGGVYFVPALVGLGAPHWKESARGLIMGLTLGTGAGQLARATLEAIAYQVRDVFDVMQAESGTSLQTMLADGGASRNDLLIQFQADIIGCPVLRSSSTDISPLGAAFLAGLAVGLWTDEAEIETLVPPRDCFEPRMSSEQRETMYAGWREAVARTVFDPSTGHRPRR